MPFVADPETLTTKDSERGLALKSKGGGSDGIHQFAIEGAAEPFGFSAHTEFELNPIATTSDSAASRRIVWRVHWWGFSLAQLDAASTMAIIREALTAYKGGHGTPERQPARVEFIRGASDEVVG